ncbi:hypothetical protein OIU78_003415 [Salix suchowensis]|nr:hypothetical protein OIU78_003415 [Salix suchowensis]
MKIGLEKNVVSILKPNQGYSNFHALIFSPRVCLNLRDKTIALQHSHSPQVHHDVATVSKSNYDNCNRASPNSLVSAGPASVLLNTTGDYYFICTVAGHCSAGQKLAITVAAGSTPSPPGTPSSPPPPPPSAASSLVATFALVFMSIAISFMYFF